ncbi:MAG: hypothetical protein PHY56_08245, partial [Candidatus Omnitrophica bacterium]|nr:hypothetical protein [Candidatus Omnitrophota bacterium]
ELAYKPRKFSNDNDTKVVFDLLRLSKRNSSNHYASSPINANYGLNDFLNLTPIKFMKVYPALIENELGRGLAEEEKATLIKFAELFNRSAKAIYCNSSYDEAETFADLRYILEHGITYEYRRLGVGFPGVCFEDAQGLSMILSRNGFAHTVASTYSTKDERRQNFVSLKLFGIEFILNTTYECYLPEGSNSGIVFLPLNIVRQAQFKKDSYMYTVWPRVVEVDKDSAGKIINFRLYNHTEPIRRILSGNYAQKVEWTLSSGKYGTDCEHIQLSSFQEESKARFVVIEEEDNGKAHLSYGRHLSDLRQITDIEEAKVIRRGNSITIKIILNNGEAMGVKEKIASSSSPIAREEFLHQPIEALYDNPLALLILATESCERALKDIERHYIYAPPGSISFLGEWFAFSDSTKGTLDAHRDSIKRIKRCEQESVEKLKTKGISSIQQLVKEGLEERQQYVLGLNSIISLYNGLSEEALQISRFINEHNLSPYAHINDSLMKPLAGQIELVKYFIRQYDSRQVISSPVTADGADRNSQIAQTRTNQPTNKQTNYTVSSPVIEILERLGIREPLRGRLICGQSIKDWAKSHWLFCSLPSYSHPYEEKNASIYASNIYRLTVKEIRECLLDFSQRLGLEEETRLKLKEGSSKAGRRSKKSLYPLILWMAREKFVTQEKEKRAGKLFAEIDIANMTLGEVPVWPVDENGYMLENLMEWAAIKNKAPPLEYFLHPRKVSFYEYLKNKPRTPAPVQLSLDFSASDASRWHAITPEGMLIAAQAYQDNPYLYIAFKRLSRILFKVAAAEYLIAAEKISPAFKKGEVERSILRLDAQERERIANFIIATNRVWNQGLKQEIR